MEHDLSEFSKHLLKSQELSNDLSPELSQSCHPRLGREGLRTQPPPRAASRSRTRAAAPSPPPTSPPRTPRTTARGRPPRAAPPAGRTRVTGVHSHTAVHIKCHRASHGCRGTWARVTLGRSRRLALKTRYGASSTRAGWRARTSYAVCARQSATSRSRQPQSMSWRSATVQQRRSVAETWHISS